MEQKRMLNKVQLIGYVGKDPELRTCPDGTGLMRFSLATSESYSTRNNEKKTDIEWHNIKIFRANDYLKNYISKGKLLYIEGKIKTENYTTNKGEKKSMTFIYALNVKIISEKPASSLNNTKQVQNSNTLHLSDEIPF